VSAVETSQAQALTDQHRRAQLQLRARALRDFTRLWPIWKATDPATFALLVTAALPLVRTYNGLSATLATSYYQALRDAEQILGTATPTLAGSVSEAQLTASLYAVGKTAERQAVLAGASPDQAIEAALTRMSGSLSRLVLQGGRDTLLASVEADKEAVGWARVTDGEPCAFCLTLASRGAVYKSEQTADFQAHDHCGCAAMPLWDGTPLPAQTARWREVYNAAQNEGESSGQLQPGENSSNARTNAVRRYLAAAH
jgi:hypothetical protein